MISVSGFLGHPVYVQKIRRISPESLSENCRLFCTVLFSTLTKRWFTFVSAFQKMFNFIERQQQSDTSVSLSSRNNCCIVLLHIICKLTVKRQRLSLSFQEHAESCCKIILQAVQQQQIHTLVSKSLNIGYFNTFNGLVCATVNIQSDLY